MARSGSSSRASTAAPPRSAKRKAAVGRGKASSGQAARGKVRGKAGRGRQARGNSVGWEIVLSVFGCLWVIVGTILVGFCGGMWYGSRLAVNVLKEIAAHDYAGPRERINRYESFFHSLDNNLYEVEEGQRNIDQRGKQSVGWVVTLRGSQERRRFQWEYDLESQKIRPCTNGALCLDVELGLISEEDAQAYKGLESDAEKYNPDDVVVRAIVKSNYSISPQDLAGGWNTPADEPVGAPLITPEEGEERWRGRKETEGSEEAEGDGSGGGGSQPNDATSVVGSAEHHGGTTE